MRIKTGFKLHNICGENIVVAEGKTNVDFSNVISFNEPTAFLWNTVRNTDFTEEILADVLVKEYGIDRDTALTDSHDVVVGWVKGGMVEV